MAASAERALSRLPDRAAAAVVEFMLGELLRQPQRLGHELRRELAGLRSARHGPYRVLYELEPSRRVVRVVHVAHRADAYRRR